MKADFTRSTFDVANHFSRVLSQQGRVMLDADTNEQTAILLHYLRTVVRDLIGPHAFPAVGGGFALTYTQGSGGSTDSVNISPGRYYVDGILVENSDPGCTYESQANYPLLPADPVQGFLAGGNPKMQLWFYLDVWERLITPIEQPSIREVALGGPDTCDRAKVVWQVKALLPALPPVSAPASPCDAVLQQLKRPAIPSLSVRLDPGQQTVDACVTPPDSKYRGLENQFYRVEIHSPGAAGKATFKWSRDNGSVATAWLGNGTDPSSILVASTRGAGVGVALIAMTIVYKWSVFQRAFTRVLGGAPRTT